MSEYYDILGISKSCSQDDIKKAYRVKAMENHPDRNPDDKCATERFQKITEAYNILGDPEKRNKYDNGYDFSNEGGGGPDISDIFQNMFGGGGPGHGNPFSQMFGGMFGGQQHQQKQANIIHCDVTLDEVFNGTTKKIDYEIINICQSCNGCGADDPKHVIKCMNCNGLGMQTQRLGPMLMQSTCGACFGNGTIIKNNKKCKNCDGKKESTYKKSFKMEVPKGIPDNFQHKMDGKGSFNMQIKQYNDLIIVFHYVNVPNTTIDAESNITISIDIKLEDILCGFQKVISPYGVDLTIYSSGYFNPTNPITFKGKGLPVFKKQTQGNLNVNFKVIYSDDRTSIQKYQDVFYKIFKRDIVECKGESILAIS